MGASILFLSYISTVPYCASCGEFNLFTTVGTIGHNKYRPLNLKSKIRNLKSEIRNLKSEI